jgi:AraC-like DNA-binding protein
MTQTYQPFQPLLTAAGSKAFGLRVQQRSPCSALRGIVDSYIQVGSDSPTPYPMVPDGTQAIFIGPDSIRVGGAQTRALELQLPDAGDYFGICFYPGALRHFFSLDLSEITNQFVDRAFLPCRDLNDLDGRLYQQLDFVQRARICELWLLRHFHGQRPNLLDRALSLVYQATGDIDVGKLAKRLEVSSRHLGRLFRRHTGLGTKSFAQIVRIQTACRHLLVGSAGSLELAGELGFFDQAHLLNEYKRQLLLSPGALARRFRSDFSNKADC